MVHYLLIKFESGFFSDEIFSFATDIFAELESALPEITDVQVCRKYGDRDSDADLLIQIELAAPEYLSTYLEHPLHQRFVERVNSHVVQRLSFDQVQE